METYTFSTALRMMRYGGKKMKPISWKSGCYVEVSVVFGLVRNCVRYTEECTLSSEEILGSWIEVKE